jgi:hypothetical protein
MSELLGSAFEVMVSAQVAGVAVHVLTTMSQWDDVVDHGSDRHLVGQAHLAQVVGAL